MFETRIVNAEYGISFKRSATGDFEQVKNNVLQFSVPQADFAAFRDELDNLPASTGDFEVRIVDDGATPVSFVLEDDGLGVLTYVEEKGGSVVLEMSEDAWVELKGLILQIWPDLV